MVADVFIQWKLSSETVISQNDISLILSRPLFGMCYALPQTIEKFSGLGIYSISHLYFTGYEYH